MRVHMEEITTLAVLYIVSLLAIGVVTGDRMNNFLENNNPQQIDEDKVCKSYDINYSYNGQSSVTERGIEIGCTNGERSVNLIHSRTYIEELKNNE